MEKSGLTISLDLSTTVEMTKKDMTSKITIIGGGKMGQVILEQVLRTKVFSAKAITVTDKKTNLLIGVKKKLKVNITTDIQSAVEVSQLIIVAVKPQDFNNLAKEIELKKDQIVISIMAGVNIQTIKKKLKTNKVVRAMPNILSHQGLGMTVWQATGLSDSEKQLARKIFKALGKEVEVRQEKKIDMATAVSGSGPAYVFNFAANLMTAAKSLGFSEAEAKLLVTQTIKGSSAMLEGNDPVKLTKAVASKGGTTEAALEVLRKHKVDKVYTEAVKAAYKRAKELSK